MMSARSGPSGLSDIGGGMRSTDRLEDLLDADPLLGRRRDRARAVEPDDLFDLAACAIDVRARKIDLVEHRDDLEVVLDREVHVREGLRLDALARVDDEQRALAGRERAADLVGEVDVPGGVDEVELILDAVLRGVGEPNGLRLDRDPALALELHLVEELVLFLAVTERADKLEDPIGEGALAVIDMRDDREVADATKR